MTVRRNVQATIKYGSQATSRMSLNDTSADPEHDVYSNLSIGGSGRALGAYVAQRKEGHGQRWLEHGAAGLTLGDVGN